MKQKNLRTKALSTIAFLLFFMCNSFSQSIEGDWYGKANIQGIELRLTLHVKATDQGYSSTWDSPDQGAFGIASTTTTFMFPDFSFTHAGAGFKYSGKVNPAYTEIIGTLEQGGIKLDITFGRTPIAAAPNSPEALKQKYDKQEVYITMRDGVKLFTSIYTPKNNSANIPYF